MAVISFAPISSARAGGPSDETEFVARINALRTGKGLPVLTVDAGLTAKARAWAQTMATKGTIWHSDLRDGITVDCQQLGENVGKGASVGALDAAFVASPLHYDNLVDPAFRSVGIGVVRSAGGVLFVAEEFMEPRVPVAASVAPPGASLVA